MDWFSFLVASDDLVDEIWYHAGILMSRIVVMAVYGHGDGGAQYFDY